MLRRQLTWMPLWKKGEHTIKQPVHVSDVAGAVIAAIRDPDSAGKIYQAVGYLMKIEILAKKNIIFSSSPKRYLLSELVDWFFRIMRRDEKTMYYKRYDMRFDPIFQARVTLANLVSPSYPIGNLHWERIEREHVTDRLEKGVPTLEDLGIQLTAMENQVPWELRPFRYGQYMAYFDDEEVEPVPNPPKVAV